MQANEIMVVEQLPIITEKFKMLADEIGERTTVALQMDCTEDTVKTVKATRAELNKEFASFEDRRKEIKKAVLDPYNTFEAAYKQFVSDQYRFADAQLKAKIDGVEDELRQRKADEVTCYASEYANSLDLDFAIDRCLAGLKINMSTTVKALKAYAKEFLDRVASDIAMIRTQEHAEEIMVEYQRCYDASTAITTIVQRHKDIAAQKEAQLEREARQKEINEAIAKAKAAAEAATPAVSPPVEAPPPAQAAQEEQLFTFAFKVRCTKEKARALKQWLIEGGYEFE